MSRGRRRELAVLHLLRDAGFVAYRAAWGNADVIAMRHDLQPSTLLIQVKSTSGGPYERFEPLERAAFLREAHDAGAAAVLAWWPPEPRRRARLDAGSGIGGRLTAIFAVRYPDTSAPEWIDSDHWPLTRMVVA